MGILIGIMAGSALGLGIIIGRHAPRIWNLSEKEIHAGVHWQSGWIKARAENARAHIITWLLKAFEKIIHRFRILALKIENMLSRLTTRVRARSRRLDPKPSQYWQDIYAWKQKKEE